MGTGLDLVKEQIRIASGERLRRFRLKQKGVRFRGHSIECRVNAEDPKTFVPSPGKITELYMPGGPGVRVDTAIYSGYNVPSHYDPLIAKVIVHGEKRADAITKMTRALEEFHIVGVKTNIPLLLEIMKDYDFIAGNVNIDFLSRFS
jgi:acetyl-CoA carboxylase biotin carboxylase subunit